MKLTAFTITAYTSGERYVPVGVLYTSGKEIIGFTINHAFTDNEYYKAIYPEAFNADILKRFNFEYFLLSHREMDSTASRKIEFTVPHIQVKNPNAYQEMMPYRAIFYVKPNLYQRIGLDYLFQKQWYLNKKLLAWAFLPASGGVITLLVNLPDWLSRAWSFLSPYLAR